MQYIIVCCLLLSLSGCSSVKRSSKTGFFVKQFEGSKAAADHEILDAIRLQEARLGDIPLPLSAIPLPDYFDLHVSTTILGYRDSILSLQDIQSFFVQEMARTGWYLKEQFVSSGQLLMRFKKPTRVAYISLSMNQGQQGVIIVIYTGFIEDLLETAA